MTEIKLEADVELDVPFFDVDSMEIVWHGHYLKYFEIARCALLDKIDYGYQVMRQTGYVWPIIEVHIRYAHAARFGQKIRVHCRLLEWENRMKIQYTIQDKDSGQRLCRGFTCQVAVAMDSGEMCYQSPPVFWQKLGLSQS